MQENLKKPPGSSQAQKNASQGSSSEDRTAASGFVQAREFYRVSASNPVEWQLLDPIGQELDTHNGRLTNLSGGGLSFRTNCEAAPGDRMHILLTDLPIIEKLDTHVTVLRVTPLAVPAENPPAWQMACALDELTTNVRDRLISSIFEQQRLTIQKSRQEASERALSTSN